MAFRLQLHGSILPQRWTYFFSPTKYLSAQHVMTPRTEKLRSNRQLTAVWPRMICQCPELLTTTQSRQMALDIRATIIGLLTHALQRVTTDLGKTVDSVIAVGQGDFLLPDIVGDNTSIQWLSDLHPEGCDGLARIGPAFAVATLLHQHLSQA